MKTRTFLAGSKWANGNFNQSPCETVDRFAGYEDKYAPSNSIAARPVEKPLTKREAHLIETAINSLALSIIRYSNTEWSNDYYDQVHRLRKLANWLDAYEKHHKRGQYSSWK